MNKRRIIRIYCFTIMLSCPTLFYGQGQITRPHSNSAIINSQNKREVCDYVAIDDTYREGLKRIQSTKTSLYGFIDSLNNIIIEPYWDEEDVFNNGVAKVKKENLFGFIEKSGKSVGSICWDNVDSFSEGLAPVMKNNKWGFINTLGNIICIPIFDDMVKFDKYSYGTERAVVEGKAVIVDKKGHLWDDFEYVQEEDERNDNILIVKKDGKLGLIDYEGEIISQPIYDSIKEFSEGLAAVRLNEKWGYVNSNGLLIIPAIWDSAGTFREGMGYISISTNGIIKTGFVDNKGTLVYEPEFDDILSYFSDGVAVVCKNDNFYILDKSGNRQKCPDNKFVFPFTEGMALFRDKGNTGKSGFLDKQGKVIIDQTWDWAYSFEDGIAFVKKNGKWGAINNKGILKLPLEWDDVKWSFFINKYIIKKDDIWYQIDNYGNITGKITGKYEI